MDEKKWEDRLKNAAEKIEVPESLEPEKIAERLQADMPEQKRGIFTKAFWKRYGVMTAQAAAAAVLVFAVGRQVGVTEGRQIVPEQTALTAEAMTETDKAMTETESDAVSVAEKTANAQASDTAADSAGGVQKDSVTAAQEELPTGMTAAADTQELYEKLKAYEDKRAEAELLMRNDVQTMEFAADTVYDTAAGTGMTDMGNGSATVAGSDFSETNLRELGVDEGDIVKTDGAYIYLMKRGSSVQIIRADGTAMETVAKIRPEELNEAVRELYVDGDTLTLIVSGSRTTMTEEETDVYAAQNYDYAKVLTYDISDRTSPKLLGSVEQEGYYHSSRKVGDDVYLFTNFYPQIEDTQEDSRIMPLVGGEEMAAANIYIPETMENTEYLVIGSINTAMPGELVSSRAIVSGASQCYVSAESIYICNREWRDGRGDVTQILKFSYKDGKVRGAGACEIDGYLNDTFSLDEHDGYLRVVSTDWTDDSEEINSLQIFDSGMKLVGKIDNIAPGESIRSARFMGDTGYFVTFKQVDPLFSVDLSDPENPQILGELKVTGFSSYLHFYGENRLLGIGYEADPETGMTTGIKLSMFDISDPSNVSELKKYVIKDANYCPALGNYKAVMINAEKNLFGFVCDDNYFVFSYDEENGFENRFAYNLTEGGQQGLWNRSFEDVRGLYIEETFYLTDSDAVSSFDMENGFAQGEKLEI